MDTLLKLKVLLGLLLLSAGVGLGFTAAGMADETPAQAEGEPAPGLTLARQAVKPQAAWTTTDHSKHPALQKEFRKGADITAACLSCHSEAENQFKKTIHWTWIGYTDEKGKRLGKAGDSLNNFCLSSNNMQDKGCLSCHPGWEGTQGAVNCLACHSRKGINFTEAFDDYNAFIDSKNADEKELAREIQANIHTAAQSIGRPTRQNCGECHFKGGGGDGVKHGDLDTSLTKPHKTLDVHMGLDGQNFECTRCHTTVQHNVAGRIYSKPAALERKSLIQDDLTPKIMCESCHGATPHAAGHKANDHADKVACQSCHIPTFARVNPTKMSWDWSQAGRLKEGKPYKEKGAFGKEEYLSIKGAMTWEKDVKPQYYWFNGAMRTLTVKDVIDPAAVVPVSEPVGDPGDPQARIFPFKIHKGKQPYDKVHNTLLAPLLSGKDGYWTTLDWSSAIAKGQAALNVPFSGEFDFVESSYFFPTTHMVAPKQNVVGCAECHVRETGRLQQVGGVYLPGRDRASLLDTFGWIAVLGALLGMTLHGLGRIFSNGRKEQNP
jgi:octaheme c-type cytochrome (tetrathionate reductase family)